MTRPHPTHLAGISPDATPEEVAAIVAALGEVEARRRAAALAGPAEADPQAVDHWRQAARLANRRSGMQRGPWRLAGRLSRRSRA